MCCALLAGCPGDGGSTDSATGTTTTGDASTTGEATASTGDVVTTGDVVSTSGTTGGDATSTGEAPTTGTTGGVGGDPMADCEAQFAELAKQTDNECMCLVAEGSFPDQQTCLAEFPPPPAGCLCPIFAGDPANAAWLACLADAERAFTACSMGLECTDIDGHADCTEAYFAVADGCGSPSKPSLGQADVACLDVPGFTCGSGESVPDDYTCDDEPDCMDMSDESDATCTFTCGSGEAIPKDLVCDMKDDCEDKSDEAEELCVFVCDDGQKVPAMWLCDGEPDCDDGSDEAMCLGRPLTRRATGSSRAGTRPTRDRRAPRAGRAAAWPTR